MYTPLYPSASKGTMVNEGHYRLALLVCILVTITTRYGYAWRHRATYIKPKPTEETRRDWFLYSLAVMIGSTLVVQLVGYDLRPMGLTPVADTVVRSCGLAVGVLAALGTLWPQFVRKNTWSSPMTSPDQIGDHRLITWGPYKYVRHPFYAACILGVLAIELTLASTFVFILPPILMLIVAIGVGKEEQQLEAVYGDQFRDYKTRSWRLIPLVY